MPASSFDKATPPLPVGCRSSQFALGTTLGLVISLASLGGIAQADPGRQPAAPGTATSTEAPPLKPALLPPATAPVDPAAKAAAEEAARRKAEIETARARCKALLAKIDAVTIPKDPIEDGACGTLAPVELVSVGKNPQVALSPPAIVNCDMVVAVHDWIKSDVQSLARKHLGQPIGRMETMSSYSCRNAYGRKMSKLSEHGKANALDIRGFATVKGETAYLLQDWGMTAVEIAAAKAAEDKLQREMAAARAKAEAEAKIAGRAGQPTSPGTAGTAIDTARTLVDRLPKPGLSIGGTTIGGGGSSDRDTGLGVTQPMRLGGPRLPAEHFAPSPLVRANAPSRGTALQAAGTSASAKSAFLRAVQEAACKRFKTVLGPESDKAHRNHFHIDLAERRNDFRICE